MAELIYWHNPKTGAVWSDVDVRFHCKDTTGWTRIVLPPPAGAQQAPSQKQLDYAAHDAWWDEIKGDEFFDLTTRNQSAAAYAKGREDERAGAQQAVALSDDEIDRLQEEYDCFGQCDAPRIHDFARAVEKAVLALAAPAAAEETPITSSIMIDKGGESPVYCLMAAYRSEQGASNALQLISAPASALAATPAPEAAPSAKEGEAVAVVESFTNGSYSRNYKLRWLKDVPEGTRLFSSPPIAAELVVAAKHVAFSNGFDAAFPQKMETLRALLKGLTPAGGDS